MKIRSFGTKCCFLSSFNIDNRFILKRYRSQSSVRHDDTPAFLQNENLPHHYQITPRTALSLQFLSKATIGSESGLLHNVNKRWGY